jgi:hypothetical protein
MWGRTYGGALGSYAILEAWPVLVWPSNVPWLQDEVEEMGRERSKNYTCNDIADFRPTST